jgi:class 3 adenylate cyclase
MRHGRPHTFLFADLVGFTALAELHGDDVAADVAIRFGAEAARLATEHGARLVKSLGDAVMIRSDDAAGALLLGMRLHEELGTIPGMPPVHVGMHTGRAVEREGDWFGAAVNLAARVSDAARGGELLVTEATVAAAGDVRGVELECLGPQTFKNVSGPTSVYSARPAPESSEVRGLRSVVAPAVAMAAASTA